MIYYIIMYSLYKSVLRHQMAVQYRCAVSRDQFTRKVNKTTPSKIKNFMPGHIFESF